MSKPVSDPMIVALRFADGLRVDLVEAHTETAAIGDFAGRLLSLDDGPSLPLIDATVIRVPHDRLRQLTGSLPTPLPPPSATPVSVRGIMHAIGRYIQDSKTGTPAKKCEAAREVLAAFFERHGVPLDFTGET